MIVRRPPRIPISMPTPSKLPFTFSSNIFASSGGRKTVYGSPYAVVSPSIAPHMRSFEDGGVDDACVATKRSSSVFHAFQKGARSAVSLGVAERPSPRSGRWAKTLAPSFAPTDTPSKNARTATTANDDANFTRRPPPRADSASSPIVNALYHSVEEHRRQPSASDDRAKKC